jgi:hypothetical protein
VGVPLITEVLDYAPADLTPAERIVLVALAEKANDTTRLVWTSRKESTQAMLLRRSGLSESGLRKVFGRLADKELEVRVPIGTDKHGRPVFAHEGRSTDFRVPVLRGDLLGNPLEDERRPSGVTTGQEEATPEGTHPRPTGSPLESERRPSGVTPSLPSVGSPSAAREEQITAGAVQVALILDTDQVEAYAIAERILDEREKSVKGDFGRYLSRWPAKDLERYRKGPTVRHAKSSVEKCGHDKAGGRRIVGQGANASRVCHKCEIESPAVQAVAS